MKKTRYLFYSIAVDFPVVAKFFAILLTNTIDKQKACSTLGGDNSLYSGNHAEISFKAKSEFFLRKRSTTYVSVIVLNV